MNLFEKIKSTIKNRWNEIKDEKSSLERAGHNDISYGDSDDVYECKNCLKIIKEYIGR